MAVLRSVVRFVLLIVCTCDLFHVHARNFMRVKIYNGRGTELVDSVVCPAVSDALKRLHILQGEVITISKDQLYESDWMSKTDLLILPGGRDLPYVRDLKDIALYNIRDFIKNGGSFLGLCAGAYFSSNYVCFEKGTPLEVLGYRDLNLFNGTARGSVYPGFDYKSRAGAVSAPLLIVNKKVASECGRRGYAYFNGGCEFLPNPGFTDYETIASYEHFPDMKAVIYISRGKGKIILSGVHPEIDVKYLSKGSYTKELWKAMIDNAPSQRLLLDAFLRKLLLDM